MRDQTAKKPTIRCDLPDCDRRLVGNDDAHLDQRFQANGWDEPVPDRHVCPDCKDGKFAAQRAAAAQGAPAPVDPRQAAQGAMGAALGALFGGGSPFGGPPPGAGGTIVDDDDDDPFDFDAEKPPTVVGSGIPTTPAEVAEAEAELEGEDLPDPPEPVFVSREELEAPIDNNDDEDLDEMFAEFDED